MNKNQQEMLLKIQQTQFAAIELNLFLDTHPANEQALQDYNNLHREFMQLIMAYQRQYGPLMNFAHSPAEYPFSWINEPWPWQGM